MMAKTSKAKTSKTVQPEPTEMTPVISAADRRALQALGATPLTQYQIDGTVVSCPEDKLVDKALKHGAQVLVDEFAPTDAVESTLAPVIVGMRNAVMTGFYFAAQGSEQRRDIELITAFKGASVLVELLEAFDAHRGYGNRRVTVGNVNVASGAQAIVGNVETTSKQESTEDSTVDPKTRKPRDA
jgi:hypothetical protein